MNDMEQLYVVAFKIQDGPCSWYTPCIIVKRKDLKIEALTNIIARKFDVTYEDVELIEVSKRTIPTKEEDTYVIK